MEVEEVRQEVREVKNEEKGEINGEGEPHTSWAHVDEMTSEHNSWLEPCGAVCNMTMLWQTKDYALTCSCWCALCGSQSWWSCCHWCRSCNRATLPCRHNQLLNSHFCTFSPIVHLWSDCMLWSSILPVANYCTLLHRENGSFEVLSLHPPSVTVDRRQLQTINL